MHFLSTQTGKDECKGEKEEEGEVMCGKVVGKAAAKLDPTQPQLQTQIFEPLHVLSLWIKSSSSQCNTRQ